MCKHASRAHIRVTSHTRARHTRAHEAALAWGGGPANHNDVACTQYIADGGMGCGAWGAFPKHANIHAWSLTGLYRRWASDWSVPNAHAQYGSMLYRDSVTAREGARIAGMRDALPCGTFIFFSS